MADEGAGQPRPRSHSPEGRMDLRDVKRLVHLMDLHGLAEVELEDEGRRIRLRKGLESNGAVPAHVLAPLSANPFPGQAQGAPAPAAAAPQAPKGSEVRSPMVGTFYRSPSPEAAPFVEVGDTIRKDTVVCIVEAMKVMNEIKADCDGEVLAVLAQNGEAVEFDQPLFLVKPLEPASAG